MDYKGKSALAGFAAVLLTSSAFVSVSAYAQDPGASPDATDSGIPDIIVTAQKRAQSINDVGLTITALGNDTLQKQGVQSLGDLAKMVPGLSFAPTDFGTPIFTLRGVGYYDNTLSGYPTTSVYVDEVPLPFAVMAAHANLDLERLEVLKGPQGTLFGQNSTGGAINYIAAKPTKELAAGMDVTVGRFGQGEANGFVSGPLSDTLGMRLSGQYGYGNGWQKSYTRDDTVGKRNYLNGRLLTDWNPTSNLRIQLNLNGWRDRSDPLASQFIAVYPQLFDFVGGGSLVEPQVAAYPFAPTNPRAADWSPDHRPKGDRWQYQGALRGDLDVTDNIVLTSISSYTKFHTDQQFDMDGMTPQLLEYFVEGNIRSFTQELRLAGGEGTPFHWVVGGNYENSRTEEHQRQFYVDGTIGKVIPSVSGATDGISKKRNYAFFASGDFEVMPGLTLKAGGRYTNSRQSMYECTRDTGDGSSNATFAMFYSQFHPGVPLTLTPDTCIVFNEVFEPAPFTYVLKEDNFSWRAGADYKVNRDLLLYVNVAKGYKAGGYPTTGALFQNSYLPVKQESLLDYEAGFKAQLLDRRLSLNGAAFWYDYRNKQLLGRVRDLTINQLIPALQNIPKSRVRGAELELTAAPVEGLQITGGVTYLDAKIVRYMGLNAAGNTADFAGAEMPFTSKWQYVASLDYTVPRESGIRPFFGATVSGRSSSTSIIGSFAGAPQFPGFRSLLPLDKIYDMPGYALLDLRAGVEAEDGDWRLTLWGRNVTNKYYIQNVVTSFEAISRYAGQPATYGVTFSYKFGG